MKKFLIIFIFVILFTFALPFLSLTGSTKDEEPKYDETVTIFDRS